jgi:mono/diheme cytochrome c family protein
MAGRAREEQMMHRLFGLIFAFILGGAWAVPAAEAAPDLVNGKKIYADKCARCHGVSGKGDGPKADTLEKKPANYTDKKKMGEFTDVQLKQVVLDGKQPMPAYKGKMSDKELEDVIAYIRTFAK